MKILYDLLPFGIDTSRKIIVDNKGNHLKTATLQTILALITYRYMYCEHQTVEIHHTAFANITNSYRTYLNYLVQMDIILIQEWYKEGEKSKGYMFTDYFKTHANIRAIKCTKKQLHPPSEILVPIDPIVEENIHQDFNAVKVRHGKIEKEVRFHKESLPIVDFRKYLVCTANLYILKTNQKYINWISGRLYTPFVLVASEHRLNMCYFEDHLETLDISRSFPLWLCVWLIRKGITIDYTTKEFIQLVLYGDFYDDLRMKLNNNRNCFNRGTEDKPLFTRDMTKDEFSHWLNGYEWSQNLVNHIFSRYYPEIFDFIEKHKNGRNDFMYYELVKLETDFIFNTICKRLYQEIPGIQILTCHDAIYFERKYLGQVLPIWNEELKNVQKGIPVSPMSDFDLACDIFAFED